MGRGGRRRPAPTRAAHQAATETLGRELSQPHPESPAPTLADKRTRDKADDFPSEVLGKGEAPAAGVPRPSMRIEYAGRSGALGWLEIGKLPAPPATESTPTPPPAEVYGRTEHTAGWVKLAPSAADLAAEAEKIASGP